MIEKLTDAQIARFPFYVDKWLKIGLATNPLPSTKTLQDLIGKIYKEGNLSSPKMLLRLDSPPACLYCYYFLSQVRDQAWSQVQDQVWSQVQDQVWDQVGSQVQDQVRDQVQDQVQDQVGNRAWDQMGNFIWGSHGASWLSYYDFLLRECNLQICKRLLPLMQYVKKTGWCLPYQNCVIVSAQPKEIHLENRILHNPNGAAILYRDGWGVWALNGRRAPREIIETPADEIDPKWVFKYKNAEIRREIVAKIGIERILKKLPNKSLDKWKEYELLALDLGENRFRPYLKMVNPSIGTYHIEGVHPDCKTVQQALNWRNQTEEEPLVLT